MKKSLKLVGIFMAVTIIAIAGGLSIYFLIEKNKTYYIYDVRIVEPLNNSRNYIYTNSEREYSLMKNKTVYMTNSKENSFEIGVYAASSTNTTSVHLTSSNPNVASLSYSRGHCYVQYHRAGETNITAELGGVKDTITVTVYDNVAESLIVFDDAYYGDYSTSFSNKIVSYADDNSYYYRYDVSSLDNGDPSADINSELLRIDTSKVNKSIFSVARIDPEKRSLNIRCRKYKVDENGNDVLDDDGNKIKITDTIDTSIVIQSYYLTSDGDIKVSHNYVVNIHVVADTPEYLQVLMSKTPDFEDGSVYVYTKDLSNQEIDVDDTDMVKEILSNQKEKKYLYAENEYETYATYFTEKVSKIYIKLRKVYTNGNIVYLNPLTYDENPFTVETDESYFKVSANKEYYILSLTKDYFDANGNFTIKLTLNDYSIDSKIFTFEYKSLTAENIKYFYSYNEETGIYTYKYWDPRTHYYTEVYNENGDVISFRFGE